MLVQELLEQEMERRNTLEEGTAEYGALTWRIGYLESLLGTLDQFPLIPARFVELLKGNVQIVNPEYPNTAHPSVDLLDRWEHGQ
jgi:hypothetical protein